jgi:hypothetical protein
MEVECGFHQFSPNVKRGVSSQKVGVSGVFVGLRPPKTPNLPHLIELIQRGIFSDLYIPEVTKGYPEYCSTIQFAVLYEHDPALSTGFTGNSTSYAIN